MAGIRSRLVRAGLIGGPEWQPILAVPLVDQVFFAMVSGSCTSTGPFFRTRTARPVWHQLRSACQVYPASWSTHQIVRVLTSGKPSGALRRARCSVVSDHVAVPSASRSGERATSRRIRCCSAIPYCFGAPPPCLILVALAPSRLNRVTNRATVSPLRRPTLYAASVNEAPALTARSSLARIGSTCVRDMITLQRVMSSFPSAPYYYYGADQTTWPTS